MRGVEIENFTLYVPFGFAVGWFLVALRTGIEQARKGLSEVG